VYPGAHAHRPESVRKILHEIVEPAESPVIAALFGQQGGVPQGSACSLARLALGHACLDVLPHKLFVMKSELAVELRLHSAAAEQ